MKDLKRLDVKTADAKKILRFLNTWADSEGAYRGFTKGHSFPNRGAGFILWDILTGLRGPDNDDRDLKDETTAKIRRAVLPNLAYLAAAKTARSVTLEEVVGLSKLGLSVASNNDHFLNHTRWAAEAILYLNLLDEED